MCLFIYCYATLAFRLLAVLICCRCLVSIETSYGRMPLLRAAWEQQLQHIPLQEVPNHVRGTDADWPVQVWDQNWTGPKGHPLSSNVHKMLIWDQCGWHGGGEDGCFHQQPLKNVEEKGLKFCEATRSSKTPKIIDYCSFYWNSLTLAAVMDRLPEIIWIKKNQTHQLRVQVATELVLMLTQPVSSPQGRI